MSQKLEDFRDEDVGDNFFYNIRTEQFVPNTFHRHAIDAFYLSMQSLEDLEHAQYAFPEGRSSKNAIVFWFLCTEAIINTVLKVADQEHPNIKFNQLKTKELSSRFSAALEILGISKPRLSTLKIFSQLHEFCSFRNELFHDRTYLTPMTFHHTHFCPTVTHANQVDVIQAFQIFLKISSIFRFAITGLDLMPNIAISADQTVFHCKLDELYELYLTKTFPEILKKHDLTLALELNLDLKAFHLITTPLCNEWKMHIKAQKKISGFANQTQTNILSGAKQSILQKYLPTIPGGHFRVADYTDNRKISD